MLNEFEATITKKFVFVLIDPHALGLSNPSFTNHWCNVFLTAVEMACIVLIVFRIWRSFFTFFFQYLLIFCIFILTILSFASFLPSSRAVLYGVLLKIYLPQDFLFIALNLKERLILLWFNGKNEFICLTHLKLGSDSGFIHLHQVHLVFGDGYSRC